MVYGLTHKFRLESARFLSKLPPGHPCRNMHGHSFLITLSLRASALDPSLDWLIDFNEVATAVRPVLARLDHKVLNEVPGLENPTSENLCIYLLKELRPVLPMLWKVSISETVDTECSVEI